MFRREHHLRIATVLQALNAELLNQTNCFFGGGTAIVLANAEYRESVDIDFLISDHKGYQVLRQLLTEKGFAAIIRPNMKVDVKREVRADQYGLRTMLQVGAFEIKFEIILEGRVQLQKLTTPDCICGINLLSELDMAATKLLANSDRWADDSVFSRDLIDLAMLNPSKKLLQEAIEKSSLAYGQSIERDLNKAIDNLHFRKNRLDECMQSLKMDQIPKAVLWKNIRRLKTK